MATVGETDVVDEAGDLVVGLPSLDLVRVKELIGGLSEGGRALRDRVVALVGTNGL